MDPTHPTLEQRRTISTSRLGPRPVRVHNPGPRWPYYWGYLVNYGPCRGYPIRNGVGIWGYRDAPARLPHVRWITWATWRAIRREAKALN